MMYLSNYGWEQAVYSAYNRAVRVYLRMNMPGQWHVSVQADYRFEYGLEVRQIYSSTTT
jgi:hypothetical protein